MYQIILNIEANELEEAFSKVKDTILTNSTVVAGNIVKARFNSQNFIDPQSVRLCFTLATSGNPANGHFHPDCGLHGMIKSLRVSSLANSQQLEYIQNYNVLMKNLMLLSVCNDWKFSQGFVEGFDGNAFGASAVYTGIATNTLLTTAQNFSLPIHSGLFSTNARLIPNGLLNLQLDVEIAPRSAFLLSTAGNETVSLSNFYWMYDEYIVSEPYKAVMEQAIVSGGITFDFDTHTNIQVAVGPTNNISTIISDSNKQLRGILTVVRPVDIAIKNLCSAGSVNGAGANNGTSGVGINATDLESIDGSLVSSWQYKIGTDAVPMAPVDKLVDSYNCTLDAFRRAGHYRDDYPLTYKKYTTGRCYMTAIDLEKSKSDDNATYNGIDSNGLNLSFSMTLTGQADTDAVVGALNSTALGNAAITTFASNGATSGVVVDHFLHHDRLITITADKSVLLDY